MSVKSVFSSFFKKVGVLVTKTFGAAVVAGITDEVLKTAYDWVKVAEGKFVDNVDKREFVVKMLSGKGIPESIARLAVELAVRLVKSEIASLNPAK